MTTPPNNPEVSVEARPLVFAATGLCLGVAFGPSHSPLFDTGLAIVLAVIVARMASARRVLALLALPIPFFVAGLALTAFRAPPSESLTRLPDYRRNAPRLFEGIIIEAPEQRTDSDRLIVDLVGTAPELQRDVVPIHGRARIRVPKSNPSQPPCGEPGDRIRFHAKLKVPEDALMPVRASPRALVARRGVALVGSVTDPGLCATLERSATTSFSLAMERARSRLHAGIDRSSDRGTSGVVKAFATGDRAGIPRSVEESFRASGLSHLLAVSGLNLAIVAGLFVIGLGFLLKRTSLARYGAQRIASIAAIPFAIGYTFLVGASPSAVRAAIMVLALLASRISRRWNDAWSALALAVILMLAWDPTTLGDVGFQLSFAAVASLLRIQPVLAKAFRLEKLPAWIRPPAEVAVASLAATVGTAPLIGRHFYRISLVGVIANVPAAPLSSLILVPLSFVGGLASLVSDLLASPFLWLAGKTAGLLIEISRVAAGLPFAEVFIPRPSILECLLFYGASIGLAGASPRGRSFGLLCGGAFTLSLALTQVLRFTRQDVEIAVLPVGQGDGSVVELPRSKVIVIDTGPGSEDYDAGESIIAPWLHARHIGSIDLLILTHQHQDHVGGTGALARQFPIREIWWNGDQRDLSPELRRILARTPNRVVAPGERRAFGDASIEVLGPVRTATSYRDVNDGSLVVRVALGKTSMLFAGDAEAVSEAELVTGGAHLKSQVLKVGHHGSRSSSTPSFLAAVQPDHAIMSLARDNGFGFPHPESLANLEAAKVKIYRTDVEGLVQVTLDGVEIELKPFRTPGL